MVLRLRHFVLPRQEEKLHNYLILNDFSLFIEAQPGAQQ
jgi:hypothetical protein